MTFEEAWALKMAEGYQYGEEALQNVRFGWEIAVAVMNSANRYDKDFDGYMERSPDGEWVKVEDLPV